MNPGYPFNCWTRAVGLLVVAVSLGGCQNAGVTGTSDTGGASGPPHSSPQQTKLPDWTSDPKLTAQLTQSVDSTKLVPRFTIKIPNDFQIQRDERTGSKLFLFRGPQHKDGTLPAFSISTIPTTLGKKIPVTVEEGFKLSMNAVRRGGRQEQWTNTLTQRGCINGQEFLRSYWSGMEASHHKLTHGVVYATVADGYFITLQGQDFEGFSPVTLPVMEAATMTFKLQK